MTDTDIEELTPPTIPPPNPSATALHAEFVAFKRELFGHLDQNEDKRAETLRTILDQRDANVVQHFAEMRAEIARLRREVSGHLSAWEQEFRGRTHGFLNAFMVLVDKLYELEERIHAFDGKGVRYIDLSRTLSFHTDHMPGPPSSVPPGRAEIPPPRDPDG